MATQALVIPNKQDIPNSSLIEFKHSLQLFHRK